MTPQNRYKIGIAGLGYVGGAVRHWFEENKALLFLYDKYKNIGSLDELNKADVVFICLPTPFCEEKNRGCDDSAIQEVLLQITGEKTIVIKSTVLPGSTENYQKSFPQHKFLMNPEFLRAKTATEDFLKPERQIIGYTAGNQDAAKEVLDILPQAPFQKIVKAKEAEMIKYFGNTFLANRVVFANQMYDICQKLGIDYEVVKDCAGADPRIGTAHFDIFHEGYRGFSGSCLPKDTKAFAQFANNHLEMNLKLFKIIQDINDELLNGNKKNEEG